MKLFYVLLFSVFVGAEDRGFYVNVGDLAPDFNMKFSDGTQTKLSDFRGKIVVLQFTASWCSVCRLEMPHLEKDLWRKYKDNGLILIGIDRDEPLETVLKFKNDVGITYPLALDPNADIFGLYANKESGVTRNVVIDTTGNIIFLTRLFEEKEYQNMIRVIEKALY
ncbi:MAG: TlpA family protein disulfide reductase [Candidatus Marinimicrobia bacterium]|jgi:peroxiredoxin|nr:TlpA family protein disulfide reductase [Candidatus Neomarinimicrobiota bacterium]MBT3501467.1 TlpA family protein disulfide reductase [Candidatus Neomarinimicrobiota bacterium]MBT3839394.1 TlpA family protein disulfide reductase [Candidatus Neomarinimicrobiota bacterium]MBT3998891.1 TlpA family protein disulfide reductase [Candidatus Neomarinimicrobiota bacterium]MBT4283093.1 TlpA family protein disulfide reductase [Candidatus Neomarinimicrobiota bacterium]